MAEGRILSRRVSRSVKIAGLSSDTSRMIYTWLIPYLDKEGRMEADPRLIKADIAPLLDHITPEIIGNILTELNSAGLITLYHADGKDCLVLTKFDSHQPHLRKDREAESRIPGPTPDLLRSNSGPTPDLLRHNIREDKLIESNLSKAIPTEKQPPVDNSPTTPKAPDLSKPKKSALQSVNTRWTEPLRADLEETMNEIRDRYGASYHQQCYLAVQTHLSKVNPEAMLFCLRALIQQNLKGNKINKPRDWLIKAIQNQDGKHNARESEAESDAYKAPLTNTERGTMKHILTAAFGGG